MKGDFNFSDVDSLLDRLASGYRGQEEFVFLVGSGVTCPVGSMAGVLDVNAVIGLVREELSNNRTMLNQLNEKIANDPVHGYQIAFEHLSHRRHPKCVNRIIRKAVLAARVHEDPLFNAAERLSTEIHIKHDDCKGLCELLEKDLNHWQLRPGLRALGHILTEFQRSFGNMVLTTNFDPLIEVSAKLAGGRIQSWMLHGDAPLTWPSRDLEVCRILHIHGSWAGDTLHAAVVLEQQRAGLEIELAKILRKQVLVVVGYGGWDDAFTRALLHSNQDADAETNVLWALYQQSEHEIRERYQPLLKQLRQGFGGNRIFFYKGIDADTFFPELLERLRKERSTDSPNPIPIQIGDTASVPPSLPPQTAKHPIESEIVAREIIPPPSTRTRTQVIDNRAHFISSLQERCPALTAQVDIIEVNEQSSIQEPNFLLFEREGVVVMAIVPGNDSVDVHKLQKTTEAQVECKLLAMERVEAVGFPNGKVHPMFTDPGGMIHRIFWDASLLVQAILFPGSQMALPAYEPDGTERKVLAPIKEILDMLAEVHGPNKLIFANIVDRRRVLADDPVLEKLVAGHPFITRFAPTPSSHLHLGNVRTALANYLLSLRDKNRSRFYLRIDNTDHLTSNKQTMRKIKDELRWLGMRWDEDKDTFQQNDDRAYDIYKRVLKVLELAEFTERRADGMVMLKSLPLEQYYCVYYDKRDGAVVTHQPPLTRKGSLFTVEALKNPAGLLVKLRDAADPLSQYLLTHFSAETQEQLDAYDGSVPPSDALQATLINELNHVLEGSSLFDEQCFALITLSKKTRKLIAERPEDENLVFLNRLLLEQAYPNEIAKSPRRTKKIQLFRADDYNAFYPFAGLIDDIRRLSDKEHLTCVLRDNRQADLTRVQAHIRLALELARQKLSSNPEAQRLFQESGINPQKSVPLPLYFHLPVVTDNGEVAANKPTGTNKRGADNSPEYTVLRKRNKEENDKLDQYTLNYLAQRQYVLAESIVAYLVATIIPPMTTHEEWKKHLAGIAFIFSHLGVHSGLHFFSRSFRLDDLVSKQRPIRCNLQYIWFAEQVVIRNLPLWRLENKLKHAPHEFRDDVPDLDPGLIERIADNSEVFANFSQILALVKKPNGVKPLSPATTLLLKEAGAEAGGDGEFITGIKGAIARIREEVRSLKGIPGEQRSTELSELLRDLRYALTAAESSPKIESILTILGNAEAAARLRRCLIGRST